LSTQKRVIFAGAGHANIAALRRLAKNPPNAELILVNHGQRIWYTGALPALIRGDITEDEACLNAARLAKSCNAVFIDASLTSFDANRLTLDAYEIPFDILAISTGAAPNGGPKPIPAFLARLKTWDRTKTPAIGIIGAGAAGVELALAIRHRLGAKAEITLQAHNNTVLPGAPTSAQKQASRALAKAQIPIATALPPYITDPIHAYTPTPTIKIRRTLQLTTHDNILATGDCAAFPTPIPRSGAIAVCQGRTLATNICALLANKPTRPFHPPSATLAILSLNADRATAWYGPISWTGSLPMTLKSRFDARWLEGG
jgi:selenide,water dikinase